MSVSAVGSRLVGLSPICGFCGEAVIYNAQQLNRRWLDSSEAQDPFGRTPHIAEWLTTRFSSARSATVEDKYRGTIPPKVYFQTFLLRVIPTWQPARRAAERAWQSRNSPPSQLRTPGRFASTRNGRTARRWWYVDSATAGRVRIGTSMPVLMYVLPPILDDYDSPNAERQTRLRWVFVHFPSKIRLLKLSTCVRISLSPSCRPTWAYPESVTPAFPRSAGPWERETITDSLAAARPPPRPLMESITLRRWRVSWLRGLGLRSFPTFPGGAGDITSGEYACATTHSESSGRIGPAA